MDIKDSNLVDQTSLINTRPELIIMDSPNLFWQSIDVAMPPAKYLLDKPKSLGLWGGATDGLHLFYMCHIAKHVLPGDKILQLNCQDGDLLFKIAAKYPQSTIVGVSTSIPSASAANDQAEKAGLNNIRFITYNDLADLNLQFAVVISISNTTLLPREELALSKLTTRLLEPNGVLFKTTYDSLTEKIEVSIAKTARASLVLRKKIYHLPLRKISLLGFIKFWKIKFFGSRY